jgi:hypothetical protein
MRRRNLIPLAILAVLGLATAAFAVIGARATPHITTITVQNASTQTFGEPTGSTPFLMALVSTASSGAGGGTLSQQRLVDYLPPDRMVVFEAGSTSKIAGVVRQPGISCVLTSYTAGIGGPTPWNQKTQTQQAQAQKGQTYTRTETLAEYSARVPEVMGSGSSSRCVAVQNSAQGQVNETVVIRSGYLVYSGVRVVVPNQTLAGGHAATHGVQGETLVFIEIGGMSVRSLKS